jgi:hypothetical protein
MHYNILSLSNTKTMHTQGITNLSTLIASMEPILNDGTYVFTSVKDVSGIPRGLSLCEIREEEGITLILEKEAAEKRGLPFTFIAAWITLNVHSALEAVGLTAAFATALGKAGISCNVVAGYYHDHIFVDQNHAQAAMKVLRELSQK